MDKIPYTAEFQTLITTYLDYLDRWWKKVQAVFLILYALELLAKIYFDVELDYVVVCIGQSLVLYYMHKAWAWRAHYDAGVFLRKATEYICFKTFAVEKLKRNADWISKEVAQMLRASKENEKK
jgi:hypothetical protein